MDTMELTQEAVNKSNSPQVNTLTFNDVN